MRGCGNLVSGSSTLVQASRELQSVRGPWVQVLTVWQETPNRTIPALA